MIAGIAGHMLDTAVSLGVLKSRSGTIRFVANPRLVDRGGRRTAPFTGPVAILVDEFSASTSEFFAAGMQALGRARVFGTRSAGQALPAAMGRLPSGDVLMHVIADHEDAKGRRIEGVGVVPDTPAPVRVADLRAGRDAALEAARAWIAAGAP
jgi:carboxyl-terminal processing protease